MSRELFKFVEFQKMNYFSISIYACFQSCMRHIYSLKKLLAFPKLKFNWMSCTFMWLMGQPENIPGASAGLATRRPGKRREMEEPSTQGCSGVLAPHSSKTAARQQQPP